MALFTHLEQGTVEGMAFYILTTQSITEAALSPVIVGSPHRLRGDYDTMLKSPYSIKGHPSSSISPLGPFSSGASLGQFGRTRNHLRLKK